MRVDAFDFDLPRERIADRPVSPRDSARCLHVRANGLDDRIMRDLPDLLQPGDVMVFNDTRVIPARLLGRRGEAKVEVTLHMRLADDTWRAFAKGAKKLKPGQTITFADGFEAVVEDKDGGDVRLKFDRGGQALMDALKDHGHIPLPPYMGRADDERDRTDYQTVYAAPEKEGAVAAPTAGLHFTPDLLARLEARGVSRVFVTLHVGAGTFLPVTADDTADHRMHAEIGEVTAEAVNGVHAARAAGGRVVAVGTTALRLLESAGDEAGVLHPFSGPTDIFITPGWRFRMVDRLVTNFHLPRSTLFMLVSAFSGLDRMRAAYAHAIDTGYRFYSYGDGSLLERCDEDIPA
ncbi:tRNA preQ1(34) S-adenosylmethionine ribosyltransferase-isomerase QueA [Caenispirillum bisanense]|uniref:tRNA preQ1(34) S-adenosylmethionine ribosyltransferase-isomerase QueA n=1 Tax=Caenispirillum bisanense TaxID=414052 RepID=UPI0031D7271E